jgi:hypothetical protein
MQDILRFYRGRASSTPSVKSLILAQRGGLATELQSIPLSE